MRLVPLERQPIAAALPRRLDRRAATVALLAAAAMALALLAIAQPARADIGETIILRCTHNESLSGFSQSAYRKALGELSADTEEYSDCSSLIRQAELAAAAGGRGSSAGSPSAGSPVALTATPSEQRAIVHAEHGPQAVKLAGGVVDPGVVHVGIASALSALPTPLLVTLAFLLVGLLLVAAGALRNRVRARRAR